MELQPRRDMIGRSMQEAPPTQMAKAPADLRSLARAHTAMGIKVLAGIAQHGKSEAARVSAVALLFERGWGRAPQAHTGANGEDNIRVVIRHIVDGRDVPAEAKMIDLVPVAVEGGNGNVEDE